MPLTWTDTPDTIDWDALEALYRLAPLGHKPAAHLRTVFTNSRFTCFAHDEQGVLVAEGRALADGADCSTSVMWRCCRATRGPVWDARWWRGWSRRRAGTRRSCSTPCPAKKGFTAGWGFGVCSRPWRSSKTPPRPRRVGTWARTDALRPRWAAPSVDQDAGRPNGLTMGQPFLAQVLMPPCT